MFMGYEGVSKSVFKDSSLMGTFPLPAPDTTHIAHINIILSFTCGSLEPFDPWMVPPLEDVDKYGASISLTTVDIFDTKIPSIFGDIFQHFHPHMECYEHTPLVWVVLSHKL
jgi:hypothetical protein